VDNLLDPDCIAHLRLHVRAIEPFTPLAIGPYRVTAFPANHDPAVVPYLYAVETGNTSLFYGTDTGSLPEATWKKLRTRGFAFDLVVLDHTYGLQGASAYHLNARAVQEHIVRMRQEGILRSNGCAFATHIAHHDNPAHEELERYAQQHGYEIAYDGLVVSL
jgi:phosphoribosyl 1,2-cyclic phosphate phosphodiesterase